MEETKKREDIPEEFKWDLTKLYKDEAAYEADLSKLEGLISECESFKGKLHESPETLSQAFTAKYRLYRHLNKLSNYASRRNDEDLGNSHTLEIRNKLDSIETSISGRLSWFEPEILSMDLAKLESYRESPALKEYIRPLNNIIRDKPHTLSPSEERILALLGEPLDSAYKTYRVLLNADSHFGNVSVDGKTVEFSRGKYSALIANPDRKVREDTYKTLYAEQSKYINTYAALLDGQVRRDVFYAKAYKFPSALAASLHNDVVETSVYESLIEAIHNALPTFYKYISLRKKCLNLEKLAIYDIFVPFVKNVQFDVPFETAARWMREAVKPLGDEYLSIIDQALSNRWIDRYENKGKRSGAYSAGCYGYDSFVLLNYSNDLSSAFTLTHECGHALHSYLSNRAQPFHLSRYRIFVAEIASTVNESLFHHYLLRNLDKELAGSPNAPSSKDVRMYLLNKLCDNFRGTVFRQVMFAEYEKIIHERVEAGESLTPEVLCDIYLKLSKLYYGEDVECDKLISYEWTRIPHFYYNFYVYKYATSFCIAQKVSASIVNGEPGAVERYLRFLESGCTKDPLDIIKDILGIDLRDPKVIQDALDVFGETIDELGKEFFN